MKLYKTAKCGILNENLFLSLYSKCGQHLMADDHIRFHLLKSGVGGPIMSNGLSYIMLKSKTQIFLKKKKVEGGDQFVSLLKKKDLHCRFSLFILVP